MKKMKNIIIFLIVDEKGFVWGLAPSKVQARVQIAWFLPKGGNYSIEPAIAATAISE